MKKLATNIAVVIGAGLVLIIGRVLRRVGRGFPLN